MGNTKEDLVEFEIVDSKKKPEISEITIYRDVDDLGRVFVTENTLRRFHLSMPAYKLVLETEEELYEIKPQEAIYIIEHANNNVTPYKIRYQNFDFNNELEDQRQQMGKRPKKMK